VRYTKQNGLDPVVNFATQMKAVWDHPTQKRRLNWPFTIRAGRVS
jgi:hypothetical protein